MLKTFIYTVILGSFFIFVALIGNFYFSEKNVILVNKSKSYDSEETLNIIKNLPLLEEDTSNIIEYNNDHEIYKKNKKKYTFWDLIKNK